MVFFFKQKENKDLIAQNKATSTLFPGIASNKIQIVAKRHNTSYTLTSN